MKHLFKNSVEKAHKTPEDDRKVKRIYEPSTVVMTHEGYVERRGKRQLKMNLW